MIAGTGVHDFLKVDPVLGAIEHGLEHREVSATEKGNLSAGEVLDSHSALKAVVKGGGIAEQVNGDRPPEKAGLTGGPEQMHCLIVSVDSRGKSSQESINFL